MKPIFLIIAAGLLLLCAFSQQKQKAATAVKSSAPGKYRYTIVVNGDTREYYVNIPTGYTGTTPLPVVFMLHGSGGNGLDFYNHSGWVKQGGKENIITVFPSSWKYNCVFDDGIQKHNAEKWNSYDLVLCNSSRKRDDVLFLRNVIDTLQQKFAVDAKRIYLVGFSNGGEMAARCAIEISDKLAAVISCAGALPPDTTLVPLRKLPVLVQIGTSDDKLKANVGSAADFPLDIPLLLSTYSPIQSIFNSYINSFGLQPTSATITGSADYTMATYLGISGIPENVFSFVEVLGLRHKYPNGSLGTFNSPVVHWNWLKAFRLP